MKTLVNVLGDQSTFATDPRDIMSTINAMSLHFSNQTYQIMQQSNALQAISHQLEKFKVLNILHNCIYIFLYILYF